MTNRPPFYRRAWCALALFALFLAAVPAEAQRSLSQKMDDLRHATAVRVALVEDSELRPYGLTARAERGVVTLNGVVPTIGLRTRAESLARQVEGVRSVVNDLELEGRSAIPASVPAPRPRPVETAATPPPAAPAETGAEYYRVKSGDTLYSIARSHDISVQQLQRINNLRSTTLNVGQRLKVR